MVYSGTLPRPHISIARVVKLLIRVRVDKRRSFVTCLVYGGDLRIWIHIDIESLRIKHLGDEEGIRQRWFIAKTKWNPGNVCVSSGCEGNGVAGTVV